MKCRHCNNNLEHGFLDLGYAPPSNAYLSLAQLGKPEKYYPLRLFVCDSCWLVQTDDCTEIDELFGPDYAYFSSTSSSWLKHAKCYSDMIIERLSMSSESLVIELASNDGYLLKNFVAAKIPCIGIEPTRSTAEVAKKIGVPTLQEFFSEPLGKQLADEGKSADLILGNNVYAHVPNINDFTAGIKAALKETGTITLEFPHLMRLIENNQFDTVYHEHFSYLSLTSVKQIFSRHGLKIYDVEELPTHGGSLRIYGCHQYYPRKVTNTVNKLLEKEVDFGLTSLNIYLNFQEKANVVKNNLLKFLIRQKQANKLVVAYGAAAKGNTLLNYGGIKPDLINCVYDAAPSKQNKYMPGSHIPILTPSKIAEKRPDYIIILPWNIAEEVQQQLDYVREWGCQFVTAVPSLCVLP